jgi:hypothetical protein
MEEATCECKTAAAVNREAIARGRGGLRQVCGNSYKIEEDASASGLSQLVAPRCLRELRIPLVRITGFASVTLTYDAANRAWLCAGLDAAAADHGRAVRTHPREGLQRTSGGRVRAEVIGKALATIQKRSRKAHRASSAPARPSPHRPESWPDMPAPTPAPSLVRVSTCRRLAR